MPLSHLSPDVPVPARDLPVPNFFIIGAAKAATTALSSLLAQHPQAAIVPSKEPHFFSFDKHYRLGWEAYLRLFSHCRGETAIGDASTSYSRIRYHPETIGRLRRHVPHARIIYMVRHPLERMESAYAEHRRTPGGEAHPSINEAILRQPMILDSSRYWEVFDAYRRAFGESALKIVWFEEYAAQPVAVFQEVCRFLGIDETFTPDLRFQAMNPRNPDGLDFGWDPDLRRRVIQTLRDDNLRFLRHFGRPDGHWGGLFVP